MAGDWLRIYRKSLDSRVFADDDDWLWKLWSWCLFKAHWRISWFEGYELQPGQFACITRQAARELRRSHSRFYRGLQTLRGWKQLALTTPQHVKRTFLVITICQWEIYQCCSDAARNTPETGFPHPLNTSAISPDPSKTLAPQGSEGGSRNKNETNLKQERNTGETLSLSEEGQEGQESACARDLPPTLDIPEFRSAWVDWKQFCCERHLPMTPVRARYLLTTLAQWGPARAIAAIRHSILHGWQGIFEPRGPNGQPEAPPETAPERLTRILRQRQEAEAARQASDPASVQRVLAERLNGKH